ncbi:MAG: chromate transporter [Anaerolineae bacterium]|nr:chromate transporter [Anaerolineae bacterium]
MLKVLLNLFIAFTKLGAVGYGGGPAMIPLIQEEAVERQEWMTEEDFIDTLAMGNALPGPIATKMSFFIGYKVGGWAGAFLALFGLLWPSTVLMMVLGIFFLKFKDMPYAQAMLKAVRPVVFALLAYTAYTVLPKSVKSWHTGLIAVVAFVAVAILNIHPALTILIAAVLGLAVYR